MVRTRVYRQTILLPIFSALLIGLIALACAPASNAPDGDTDGNELDFWDRFPDGDADAEEEIDGVVVGCTDLTGRYDGVHVNAAEEKENLKTWVVVERPACDISFLNSEGGYRGTIAGGDIRTDSDLICEGGVKKDGRILLACGGGLRITLTPATGDGDKFLALRPTTLEFGNIRLTEEKTLEARVQNFGSAPVTFYGTEFSPSTSEDFRLADPGEWEQPFLLDPGDEHPIRVTYLAAEYVSRDGVLWIRSDADNGAISYLNLSVRVKDESDIVVEMDSLDFGAAEAGTQSRKSLIVRNAGGAPGQVEIIKVVENEDGVFRMENPPEMPFEIAGNSQQPVEFSFNPREGTHQDGQRLEGRVKVTYLDAHEALRDIYVDMAGRVGNLPPSCIEITPLQGITEIESQTFPGPGMDFGMAQVSEETRKSIIIRNCGYLPLDIHSMEWQPDIMNFPYEDNAFSEAPGQFQDDALEPLEEQSIDIVFTPEYYGQLYASSFSLYSSAKTWAWLPEDMEIRNPAEQPIQVFLLGRGARSHLKIRPTKLDFSRIPMECCSRPLPVVISSLGELPVTIEDIQITASADDAFRIVEVSNHPPVDLGRPNPSSSMSFKVQFCPQKEDMAYGTAEIESTALVNPEVAVPLQGGGTTISSIVDEFDQLPDRAADILWVVDCSASMEDEQQRLTQNLRSFIEQAVTWDALLNFAVVSTDIHNPNHSGRFQGEPPVLVNHGTDALTPEEMITAFSDHILLGTNCDSGQEAGLLAARLALSEPLISGDNKGFLREQAKLAIVFISDEPEQSYETVESYIDFFQSIKGERNRDLLEIYALVGDYPDGCVNPLDFSGAMPGPRYIDVARECNPYEDQHFVSICANSYQPLYDALGANLFRLRHQFFLSHLVDPDTLVVVENGTEVHDWAYDEAGNSIVFPEDDPPPPGAHLVVSYDVVCIR